MRLTLLFCFFFSLFTAVAQTWTPMGPTETSGNSISQTAAFALYSAVSADGSYYISYIDDWAGPNNVNDLKVHVRKFNGTSWVDLGGASPEVPSTDFFPITCEGNDVYVAYSEPFGPNDGKLTVKRYNSSSSAWELVGNAAFSAGAATATGITAANGKIYVAYGDESVAGKIVVKFFDKTNAAAGWQTLGAAGFSTGAAASIVGSHISIAVHNTEVWVLYNDASLNSNNGGLVAKRFNGTAWIDAGTNIISGSTLGFRSRIAFDASGKPYVMFCDATSRVDVYSLTPANSWQPVATQPVAASGFMAASLAIIGNTPYVAYTTLASGAAAQVWVKQLVNGAGQWQHLTGNAATAAPTPNDVITVNLDAASNGKLFISYQLNSSHLHARSFNTGTVAPVTYTNFVVSEDKGAALVRWTTVNEINNSYFMVEHSVDGKHFDEIGKVLANTEAGNTEKLYVFKTNALNKGVHFFRLRQVDRDGRYAYTDVISLTITTVPKIMITAYPNPVKNILTLKGDIAMFNSATVVNMQGMVVASATISNARRNIDVSSLPRGAYVLMLHGSANKQAVSFIK